MLKQVFYLTLAIYVLGCGSFKKQPASPPPNIIFILADDLGYGDTGPYSQQYIQTPNLDRMAAEGMRLTQFYAGSSVCAPSRAVLMTGLHTGHTEIRGNKQFGKRNGQQPLSPGTASLPLLLKKAGYTTAMVGKWGLGNPGTSGDPLRQGWDYFYGYADQVLAHNYFPEYLWRNGEKVYLKNEVQYLDTAAWHGGLGSVSTRQVEYSHDLFVEDALRFIEKQRSVPFFLYLPFTIPHDNGEAPDTARHEVPGQGMYAEKNWEKNAKDYAAMITRMDEGVGAILARLDALGLGENTLVVFTSDNGSLKRSYTAFFNSSGGLRGGKRDLYEGGIRMPFIARWPGKIRPGTTSGHVGAFWDVLPTLLELAGAPPAAATDGISFLPALLGKGGQGEQPWLYWEFHEGAGSQAIRQGKWKAVRRDAIRNPGNPVELYDLSADEAEAFNLAEQQPEKCRELDSLMSVSRVHSALFPFFGE